MTKFALGRPGAKNTPTLLKTLGSGRFPDTLAIGFFRRQAASSPGSSFFGLNAAWGLFSLLIAVSAISILVSSCLNALPRRWIPWCRRAAVAVLLAGLAACAGNSGSNAPGNSAAYYRVQEGDTLSQIARKYGQSTSDLMRWNKIGNANQISTGMLLRVAPLAGGRDEGREPASRANGRGGAKTSPYVGSAAPASAPVSGITLIWPAQGQLAQSYGSGSRGLTITGAAGSPVVAAAAGTVLYANNGLRGYGNMVIVRHEHDFMTVYAHNGKLLVKKNQSVKQGQRIADMGSSDASRVGLYFELRRGGQPVNPIGVLPKQ